MKCINCKKINVIQANYCIKCGHSFSDKEKEIANKKSLLKKVVDLKKWYSNTPIKKITDSTAYKIGTIIGTIIVGLIFIYLNGNYLKLEKSNNYTYTYDKDKNAYYLYLKENESNINLYLPHKTNKFYVKIYDKTNNLIKENEYTNINDIKIILDDNENNYYEISYSKHKTKRNTIKVYTREDF